VAGALAMLRQPAIFILDEFDRVTDSAVKMAIADLIKNVSDNHALVTLVLVGVGGSIADLIGEHPSVARNLVQIEMPVMADVEAMHRLFKETLTVQAVVPALQAFTEPERGAILDKIPFGTQSHYRLHEPMMRPFLRIKGRTLQDE